MGYFVTRLGGRGKKLINSGNPDINYAYYCFTKHGMLPSQYTVLDDMEKAFIIAAIDLKLEADKERDKKLKKKARK